jgi:Zn-finger protein
MAERESERVKHNPGQNVNACFCPSYMTINYFLSSFFADMEEKVFSGSMPAYI